MRAEYSRIGDFVNRLFIAIAVCVAGPACAAKAFDAVLFDIDEGSLAAADAIHPAGPYRYVREISKYRLVS